MKSLFVLAFTSIWNRKGQSAVLLLTLAISVFFCSTALALKDGTENSFERMDAALQRSHFLFILDGASSEGRRVQAWWKAQPETLGMTDLTPVYQSASPTFQGKDLQVNLLVSELDPLAVQDKVLVTDIIAGQNPAQGPAFGQVWIPTITAQTSNIHLGDTLTIPTEGGGVDLKVGALIIDPHFSSGLTNPIRVWVKQGSLPLFLSARELTQSTLGVRIKAGVDLGALSARMKSQVDFTGWQLPFDVLKTVYTFLNSLISAGLLLVAFLGLLLALFLLVSNISNTIRADYKTIGLLKAAGYTPAAVTTLYLLQYGMLAVASLVPALAAGWLLTSLLLGGYALSVGASAVGFSFAIPAAISASLLIGAVAVVSYLSARKAGQVLTVQAIRYGAPRESQRAWSVWSRLISRSGPVGSLVLQFTSLNLRRTLTLAGVTFLVSILAVLSLNLMASFDQMKAAPENWGFDKRDLTLDFKSRRAAFTSDNLKSVVLAQEHVAAMAESDFMPATVVGASGPDIVGTVIGGDWNQLGFKNAAGSHPLTTGQVSLAAGSMKRLKKQVGDTIQLKMEGQTRDYLITGTYPSLANFGEGFRIRIETVLDFDPFYRASSFMILTDHSPGALEAVMAGLSRDLGGYARLTPISASLQVLTTISIGFASVMSLILAVFLLASALIISGDVNMTVQEQKKLFGILKSTGFTPRQLRLALTGKSLLSALLGIVVAGPAAWFAVRPVFNLLGPVLGLNEYPVDPVVLAPVIALVLLAAFVAGVAALASRCVRNLNPRLLIVE